MSELFCAACRGDLGRVQGLVEEGVDKEKTGFHRETPLWAASRKGHLSVVRYLVENAKADMEKSDTNGCTPLVVACVYGHMTVVRYLLGQGANTDNVTDVGMTPLHYAAQYGCLETAKLLMVYGANVNARDNRGYLPIDMGNLNNEEIRQAIRDETSRRMDQSHKRNIEQDQYPNEATSSSVQKEDEEEQSNKKTRRGKIEVEEGEVAEEDQKSE